MFYNTYRATKSSMRSAEKNRLSGTGQNIINQRDRLLNLQKRQKLKDLLITKFMQKYGIHNPEQILEEEITKFLQGEKLNDVDLKRLDLKVKNLLRQKASKEKLKNTLTQSLQETNSNQVVLPKIDTKNEIENTLSPKIIKNRPTRLTTEPMETTLEQPKLSSSGYNPVNTCGPRTSKKIYKKPEEELAELEAEFAEEEKKNQKKYTRLDFSDEGDEWSAIAKYNRKLYEEQILEEKMKDRQLKWQNKQDLDWQIKQRLRKEYEDELKDKEYDKIVEEHRKKMDELDKEKQEQVKMQIMREKASRDEQMRQNYIKKRIDLLKEKKFEKSLVKTIQEGIEKDKKEALEKKKRENKREEISNCKIHTLSNSKNYTINCSPSKSFITFINTLKFIVNNKNVNSRLRFLQNDKNKTYAAPADSKGNITYIYTDDENFYGYRKNSSGGLSAGAIVAIVLGCVAAILAVGITILFLSRKTPPPPNKNIVPNISNSTANINENNK